MTYEEAEAAVRALALELAKSSGKKAWEAIEVVTDEHPEISGEIRQRLIAVIQAQACGMSAQIILVNVKQSLASRLIEPEDSHLATALGLDSEERVDAYVTRLFKDSSLLLSLSSAAIASITEAFPRSASPTTCS
jgi:hypothetical protein